MYPETERAAVIRLVAVGSAAAPWIPARDPRAVADPPYLFAKALVRCTAGAAVRIATEAEVVKLERIRAQVVFLPLPVGYAVVGARFLDAPILDQGLVADVHAGVFAGGEMLGASVSKVDLHPDRPVLCPAPALAADQRGQRSPIHDPAAPGVAARLPMGEVHDGGSEVDVGDRRGNT